MRSFWLLGQNLRIYLQKEDLANMVPDLRDICHMQKEFGCIVVQEYSVWAQSCPCACQRCLGMNMFGSTYQP